MQPYGTLAAHRGIARTLFCERRWFPSDWLLFVLDKWRAPRLDGLSRKTGWRFHTADAVASGKEIWRDGSASEDVTRAAAERPWFLALTGRHCQLPLPA